MIFKYNSTHTEFKIFLEFFWIIYYIQEFLKKKFSTFNHPIIENFPL